MSSVINSAQLRNRSVICQWIMDVTPNYNQQREKIDKCDFTKVKIKNVCALKTIKKLKKKKQLIQWEKIVAAGGM